MISNTTSVADASRDYPNQIPATLVPEWQKTVDLMASIYHVPAGLIMRVHTHQIEVFVSSRTEGNPYEPGELADLQTGLYCETVMAQRDQLYVPNALIDPVWDHNPDIALGMICYLGVPIIWPDGTVFGTICVLDAQQRTFATSYKDLLWQFKGIIEGNLRFITELQYRQHIEEELRKARDAAEAANQAKSIFLASMSHELRTPLNAILGFAQLIHRRDDLDTTLRNHLGIVRRSGEHLLTLINNVLDLSRIEAGRVELHETNFDLYQLLNDMEDMFQLRALDKRLQLVFDCMPDVPRYVKTDQVKLRQILINLLSNAVKFTDEGSVTLRISRGAETGITPNSVRLHGEVADTGVGIAQDERSSIFEAFTQTRSGHQATEGTGLGLTITRRFVQLLGGDIALHSEVGRGSVFAFDIVVGITTPSELVVRESHRHVIGLEPGQPHYRILVVDDRWTNRHLLVQLLAPLGFDLREASNGQEALSVWEAWQPHLIWMDMRMPVIDGYEAIRRIKATLQGQATVVVALTASTLEEERAVVLSTGCDDFVRKPFRESDIFDTMHRHLGVRYIYDEPAMTSPSPSAATDVVITPEMLATVPDAILASLEQAVLTTNPDMIDQIIDQVHLYQHSAALALATLADDFEYTRIIALIQAARQHDT